MRVKTGGFYDGDYSSVELLGSARIGSRFNGSIGLTRQHVTLPYGTFTTDLVPIKASYSFTTLASLQALVQYNSDARTWSSNIRFNVIHRPLSDFFLVYNERRNSLMGDLQDRALIAKVTYMFQR